MADINKDNSREVKNQKLPISNNSFFSDEDEIKDENNFLSKRNSFLNSLIFSFKGIVQTLHSPKTKSFFLTSIGIAIFLICIIYLWLCLIIEKDLKTNTTEVISDLNAQGFDISYNKISSSYHPIKSGIYIDELSFTPPAFLGRWKWEVAKLYITSFPLSPNEIIINATGLHKISSLNNSQPTRFAPQNLLVRVKFDNHKTIESILASIDYSLLFGKSNTDNQKLTNIDISIKKEAPQRYNFSFDLKDWQFIDEEEKVQSIDFIYIHGNIDKASPKSSIAQSIQDWQKDGGIISLDNLRLNWQSFTLEGSAKLSLNDEMQPLSDGIARIRHFMQFVDMLELYGIAKKKDTNVIKIVYGSNTSIREGELFRTTIGISDNKIHIGKLPLITLEELPIKKISNQ